MFFFFHIFFLLGIFSFLLLWKSSIFRIRFFIDFFNIFPHFLVLLCRWRCFNIHIFWILLIWMHYNLLNWETSSILLVHPWRWIVALIWRFTTWWWMRLLTWRFLWTFWNFESFFFNLLNFRDIKSILLVCCYIQSTLKFIKHRHVWEESWWRWSFPIILLSSLNQWHLTLIVINIFGLIANLLSTMNKN